MPINYSYDGGKTVHCNRPGNPMYVILDRDCDRCSYFGGHVMEIKGAIICNWGTTDLNLKGE